MSFSTMTAQKFYRQVLIEAGRPSLDEIGRALGVEQPADAPSADVG